MHAVVFKGEIKVFLHVTYFTFIISFLNAVGISVSASNVSGNLPLKFFNMSELNVCKTNLQSVFKRYFEGKKCAFCSEKFYGKLFYNNA
jgi:hypothetical protein